MSVSAGPSAATIAASATVAAARPMSDERQPRVMPDGEHDRERLDELDRAREERGGNEERSGHA